MLNAFLWMFKVKEFKKHFFILLMISIMFFIFAFLWHFISSNFQIENLLLVQKSGFCIIYLILGLFLLGYFWILTDSIIERKWEIISSNIYDGKVRKRGIISLPQIKFFKFIWRGFASIVATIFLSIPIVLLVLYNIEHAQETIQYFSLDSSQGLILYAFIYVFISSFIPALARNYAQRDSVVAVWNLPKAIFIMTTYPVSYFFNTVLFLLLTFCNGFAVTKLFLLMNINIQSFQNLPQISLNITPDLILLACVIYFINIYLLYVNAYLLGTLTPPGEDY